MKQLFIQLNVAIVLLMTFSFHCMGADKYTLEYKLEKGKTYKQRMVSDMNMKMDAMGQEINMTMKSEMGVHYDVTGQTNDLYDIRITYQKMKFNMSAPASVSIDSDSPENSSDKNAGNLVKSFMGVPIDVQLTKQGKVISIKGIEKMVEKINSANNEQYKLMLGQQFSEKAIRQSIEQSSSYFPGKPVAINDSWDVVLNLNSSGIDIINKMKLTLKQVKDNIATLEVTGTITTPEGGAVSNIQGMDAKVSAKGEQAGTIQIDMKTGWIVRSELTQKYIQNIEIMGQTMPQEMDIKVIVTAD